MLQAIAALGRDKATKALVLISKPPAPAVAKRVLAAASKIGKPVVVNFIGADTAAVAGKNLYPVITLEEAAAAAVALARGRKPAPPRGAARIAIAKPGRFAPGQRWIRGLYSGGTFCYEASLLLGKALGKSAARVWSNAPVDKNDMLEDVWHSREHTLVDLGDDVFTRGRPHPMIDHRLRNERLLAEADDAEVAVILFDVVLGYGSHADPAGEVIPAIIAARVHAQKRNRRIAFVGFVCGTPADPQDLGKQEAALLAAGVQLAPSNAAAVRLAAALVASVTAPGRAPPPTRKSTRRATRPTKRSSTPVAGRR
jgi:hypothetical protein